MPTRAKARGWALHFRVQFCGVETGTMKWRHEDPLDEERSFASLTMTTRRGGQEGRLDGKGSFASLRMTMGRGAERSAPTRT